MGSIAARRAGQEGGVGLKNTDAYSSLKLGEKKTIEGRVYTLSMRWMENLNCCPNCGGIKTFHHQRLLDLEARLQKKRISYENVFRSFAETRGNTRIVAKYDLCLNCSHEWCFQIFCWELNDRQATRID